MADRLRFGVLGPVVAWDNNGAPVGLKGPRQRAVLARLIVARGRVVPVELLVDDLWTDPPAGALSAVRTFVASLRRAIEPERAPRAPARLLVTEGPGYALRAGRDDVDAWRFEQAINAAAKLAPAEAQHRLDEALTWWRGPAYAEYADEGWAHAERSRLAELRLQAIENRADARLSLGRAAEVVAELDAHVIEHPWREEAWRLLALALYRADRQGDALAVLRRARALLVEQLAVDPGPALRRLEHDILNQADHLTPTPQLRSPADHLDPAGQLRSQADHLDPAGQVWSQAVAAYERTVGTGARARLESTVGLLRGLAVTGGGGLEAARQHRLAAITAAEELGDPDLTARVIGAYDVPAIWTRSDDEHQAAQIVTAAERALAALPPPGRSAARVRLLATVAVESRGTRAARGPEAAREAEEISRGLDDPGLRAFVLNGVFMQSFHRAGLAPERDQIGADLIELSTRHGLTTFEVLGHLIRLQARSALADFATADHHAAAADHLAERHELPLVGVFTTWYRALRLAAGDASAAEVEEAYRSAASLLPGAGMPGLEHGLLPLALLSVRLRGETPDHEVDRIRAVQDDDFGPYEPWARPLVLLAENRRNEAAKALERIPDPPRDLLLEARWCLAAHAAVALGNQSLLDRAQRELAPAKDELAGAGSGLITLGPVAAYLAH